MKRSKFYPILLIVASVILMLALSLWNFIESRRNALEIHEHWAERVSHRIQAERVSSAETLSNLAGMRRKELRFELLAQPNFAGAYWFDVRTHEFERWVVPAFDRVIKVPDPRVVVSQLRATKTHETELGPVLLMGGSLFMTTAIPLDARHAVVVIQEAQEIKKILDQESVWGRAHVYVYDSERHPLYIGGSLKQIEPSALDDALAQAETGLRDGFLHAARRSRWTWTTTFHLSKNLDWVFILTEPTLVSFYPFLLYLGSLICLIWLSRLPWEAVQALRRARDAATLKQFANRVDNFARGKDVVLSDPPYPFNELLPIVQVLRWMMPQWKKAEAYPKEYGLERKLLSLLIESLPEGILFFNAQGALQLGNELGKVFLSLQQELGREYKMMSGVQVPRGFLEPFAEPVFSGQQVTLGKEVEVGWADGKHLYRIWVEAVQVEDKVEGYIVVVRDITFRKQWEYVQEQVLSGITHDLRGPLSAIMGYLDLLKRQLKSAPPKVLEYVGLAREAGNRLTQMISDILDVVRFEQGKIEMDVQSVAVQSIFERITTIFGVMAGQKGVHLNLTMHPQDLKVTGDQKLLERVLDNLVGNAIKFTPTGGTITVSAWRRDDRTLISVADTGRGIPKEAQSRVFDKFQQVRPGDRSSGYGLGLAVVKFIVEAHKGDIRLESEVEKGSTFTLAIPDQPLSARVDASPGASTGESVRS